MFEKHVNARPTGNVDPKATRVVARCPACRAKTVFDPVAQTDAQVSTPQGHFTAGIRTCANPDCQCLVFFTSAANGVRLLPPETLDFDATNLPKTVLDAFEEAIMCHAASCYRASAMMVRKTLEELCLEQGALGPNLKEKVKALGTKIVIPLDLAAGIDDLRLLGNDAAHVSAQSFNQIGKDEVETGIDLAKELRRATYQHKALVARMALHKIPPGTP